MSPSEAINQMTRRDWRELGFYYDSDEQAKCWRFVGSPEGLARFVGLLDDYVRDSRNAMLSEHEHYGPYMYLTICTAASPDIDEHSIRGTLEDLARLRDLVQQKLLASSPGSSFAIGSDYADSSSFKLCFEVEAPGFDPAAADPELEAPAT